MALILFPSELVHGHETTENHCDDHFSIEADLCHISVYHSSSSENHCEHDEHFVDSVEECELCDYITSRKIEIFLNSKSLTLEFITNKTTESCGQLIATTPLIDSKLGRAPPSSYNS